MCPSHSAGPCSRSGAAAATLFGGAAAPASLGAAGARPPGARRRCDALPRAVPPPVAIDGLGRASPWRRARPHTPDDVKTAMVACMQREAVENGAPWSAIARHMLGLHHGRRGARLWRQVWSDHKLKNLPPEQGWARAPGNGRIRRELSQAPALAGDSAGSYQTGANLGLHHLRRAFAGVARRAPDGDGGALGVALHLLHHLQVELLGAGPVADAGAGAGAVG